MNPILLAEARRLPAAGAVAAATLLVVAGSSCHSQRGPRYGHGELGEPQAVTSRAGVRVGELQIRLEPGQGGRGQEPRLVVGRWNEERVLALGDLPAVLWRHEIGLQSRDGEEVTLMVREVPCRDEEFLALESNSGLESSCTPIVGHDFRGIAVAAPQVVSFPPPPPDDAEEGGPGRRDLPKVIIAGRFEVDAQVVRELGQQRWVEGPTIVLVNTGTGARVEKTVRQISRDYDYEVLGMDVSYAPDPEPRDEGEGGEEERSSGGLVHLSSGSVFNADVGQYMTRPEEPTEYTCFATFGPHESNHVTITVR